MEIDAAETSRDIAFSVHAILQSDLFIVPDTTQDSRFTDNPLVTGDLHIRFYAGAPLITVQGHALGMLCVIDRVPRQLTAAQQEAFRRLARQMVQLLERLHLAELSSELHVALLTDDPIPQALQACAAIFLRQLDAAMVRVWMLGPGDLCLSCEKVAHCLVLTQCLHLMASEGLSNNL